MLVPKSLSIVFNDKEYPQTQQKKHQNSNQSNEI